MEISLDSETVKAYAQHVILSELDQEARNKIVVQAVAEMFIPKREHGWGPKPKSAFEVAFENAVQRAAVEITHKMVEEDETIMGKIKEEVGRAVSEIVDADLHSEGAKKFREIVNKAVLDGLWAREEY